MRSLVFVAFLVGLALCTPVDRVEIQKRETPDDDAEVVGNGRGRGPVVIVDTPNYRGGFFGDSSDVDEDDDDDFFGFRFPQFRPTFQLDWVESMRRRIALMNQMIADMLNRSRPVFPGSFPGSFDFDFDDLPPNYDNSTFTTKTVNGSVISVNETIKKHHTNESTFIFHVKTVQVRPDNETRETDAGRPTPPEEAEVPTNPARPTDAPQRRPEIVTAPNEEDDTANDVSGGRRFKRLASEIDELENKLAILSRFQ